MSTTLGRNMGPMSAEDAAELDRRLRAAVAASDWDVTVRLLEDEWSVLIAVAVSALDQALRAVPADIWRNRPILGAVRNIRLHTRGQSVELDRIAAAAALPTHPAELREVGSGEHGRHALSSAAALMIAYRVHGQHRRAVHFARIVEELARPARASHDVDLSVRVPTALLQAGITRLLAGDYHSASLILREAYELRDETWDRRVGGDAAGKLALLYAVIGNTTEADKWLHRHDDGEGASGWMVPLVQLSARAAELLIATDRLDQTAAETALRTLEIQVNRERSWAPFVTFARARYDLVWGDPRAAIERIDRTRDFTGGEHRQAGIEARLDGLRADLLLAVGRTVEAQELLSEPQSHPYIAAVAARATLLAGKVAAAKETAATGLVLRDIDPRAQVDLLVTSALAEGSEPARHRYLHQAVAAATVSGTRSPFAMARRAPLEDLAITSAHRFWITDTLARAPEVLPHTIDLIELTTAEQRILALLARGENRPAIARSLYISENTVRFHVRNLYRKLSAASREEALATAKELRLLSPE